MIARAVNLHMLEIVAEGLGDLLPDVAFVGGATIALFLPDDIAAESEARPTDDVDCVIHVASRSEYARIEKRLRVLGFKHVPEGPICRWNYSGVLVDVMPTDGAILGFSNRWYEEGLASAEDRVLPNGRRIRVFALPHFFASKVEAFQDRGKGDFQASKDFEDIVTVLDGRPTVRADLAGAPVEIRRFIRQAVEAWEKSVGFVQSIVGHLPAARRNIEGARRVLDILRNIPA